MNEGDDEGRTAGSAADITAAHPSRSMRGRTAKGVLGQPEPACRDGLSSTVAFMRSVMSIVPAAEVVAAAPT